MQLLTQIMASLGSILKCKQYRVIAVQDIIELDVQPETNWSSDLGYTMVICDQLILENECPYTSYRIQWREVWL